MEARKIKGSVDKRQRQVVSTEETSAASSTSSLTSQLGDGTRTRGSHTFSHARRLWELQSFCSILFLSLAPRLRSFIWAFFCGSSVHWCEDFSCSLLLRSWSPLVTFRSNSCSNSCSNSSVVLILKLGCLLKSSQASSSFSWNRCFSSACSPEISASSQILHLLVLELFSHRSLVTAVCFDVETRRPLQLGAAASGARAADRGRASRYTPPRLKKPLLAGRRL